MFILATNVISELRKAKCGRAYPNVGAWSRTVSPANLLLLAISVLELESGVVQNEREEPRQAARFAASFMSDEGS